MYDSCNYKNKTKIIFEPFFLFIYFDCLQFPNKLIKNSKTKLKLNQGKKRKKLQLAESTLTMNAPYLPETIIKLLQPIHAVCHSMGLQAGGRESISC